VGTVPVGGQPAGGQPAGEHLTGEQPVGGQPMDGAAVDGVPVAAVGAQLPAGQPVAVVEVADAGPGLSATDAAHVFERLYRADPSRARRHGGAGLGLAIVAAIVQAHGGRVELYTAAGTGARFRVLLPGAAEYVPAESWT
jgi:two-component system OmpR family sensor kinase